MIMAPILQLSKDAVWLALAKEIAMNSNDPSTKVGCVLVNQQNQIVSAGFNHLPLDCDPKSLTREEKNALSVHAEHHALSLTKEGSHGTAYLWPVEPCHRCARKLSRVGIERVVAPIDEESGVYLRWHKHLMSSRNHLDSLAIKRDYLNMNTIHNLMSEVDEEALRSSLSTVRQLWER